MWLLLDRIYLRPVCVRGRENNSGVERAVLLSGNHHVILNNSTPFLFVFRLPSVFEGVFFGRFVFGYGLRKRLLVFCVPQECLWRRYYLFIETKLSAIIIFVIFDNSLRL